MEVDDIISYYDLVTEVKAALQKGTLAWERSIPSSLRENAT
jgi:hypothetical protein